MGKYLDKFKRGAGKVKEKFEDATYEPGAVDERDFDEDDYLDESNDNLNNNSYSDRDYDEVGIQPSQKPESFHHFILENQYKDLERSIRGFKDVFDKDTQTWKIKRKAQHCFTDEEAEDIIRTAQSHLATDIKLSYISKESFPIYMTTLYKTFAFLFERIAEYRYGRYNTFDKDGKTLKVNYELQGKMKEMNHKIFLELITRVQANYSRAIQGQENKATHQSVKGQESLQNIDSNYDNRDGGYYGK